MGGQVKATYSIVVIAPPSLSIPEPFRPGPYIDSGAIVASGVDQGSIAVTIAGVSVAPAAFSRARHHGPILTPDGRIVHPSAAYDVFPSPANDVREYGNLIWQHAAAKQLDRTLRQLGAVHTSSDRPNQVRWTIAINGGDATQALRAAVEMARARGKLRVRVVRDDLAYHTSNNGKHLPISTIVTALTNHWRLGLIGAAVLVCISIVAVNASTPSSRDSSARMHDVSQTSVLNGQTSLATTSAGRVGSRRDAMPLFDDALRSEIEGIATLHGVDASVAVYDAKSQQSWHTDDKLFYSASTIKIAILEALLVQRQAGKETLSPTEISLARNMITISDNEATNELFRRAGGVVGMRTFYEQIGAPTTAQNVSSSWGLTKTTAQDQLRVLRLFAYSNEYLNRDNRTILQTLLADVSSTQRWGISAGLPSSSRSLLKNGWLPHDGVWHVHSIGRVIAGERDYVVAVLTSGAGSEAEGRAATEAASRALNEHTGGTRR